MVLKGACFLSCFSGPHLVLCRSGCARSPVPAEQVGGTAADPADVPYLGPDPDAGLLIRWWMETGRSSVPANTWRRQHVGLGEAEWMLPRHCHISLMRVCTFHRPEGFERSPKSGPQTAQEPCICDYAVA